jgi:hypothetical protein
MHLVRFAPALLALVCAAPVWAVDLSKIERTIAREPAYQGKPKYGLLLFGPEAKVRMWLVVDGDTLYLDRQGNGDLTACGCRIGPDQRSKIELGAVPDSAGTLRQAKLSVRHLYNGYKLEFEDDTGFLQEAGSDRKVRLEFGDRPEAASIVHFGGPLAFHWYRQPPKFVPGQECEFDTWLGTPGIGKGSFAAVPCCCPPKKARFVAQIDFPHRDVNQPPIRKAYPLGDD